MRFTAIGSNAWSFSGPARPKAADCVTRIGRSCLREAEAASLRRRQVAAGGDARPDSDYDVAVFLKDLAHRWEEIDRIVPVVTDIVEQTGAVIHAMPPDRCPGQAPRAGAYRERTPLMHELRGEGVDL